MYLPSVYALVICWLCAFPYPHFARIWSDLYLDPIPGTSHFALLCTRSGHAQPWVSACGIKRRSCSILFYERQFATGPFATVPFAARRFIARNPAMDAALRVAGQRNNPSAGTAGMVATPFEPTRVHDAYATHIHTAGLPLLPASTTGIYSPTRTPRRCGGRDAYLTVPEHLHIPVHVGLSVICNDAIAD